MEFKGTKGTWEVEYVAGEEFMRSSVNNGSIDVWADVNDVSIEEANANALLISKAPEMLEMLNYLVKKHNEHLITNKDIDEAKQLVKEATEL